MTDNMEFAAYRAMRLGRCPFCDSTEVEGARMETDAAYVWQDVTCRDCNSDWQEVYAPAYIEYEVEGRTIRHDFINPGGGSA